ncbi:MAG: EamA family transporter, partial [Cyanobacteria bacterium J06648_11]
AIFAVLGLGIVSEGMGQRFLADCLEQFSSSFIALLALLEPILSSVLAWVVFSEQLSPTTWVGFAIVLAGIYFAQASQSATQASPVPVANSDADPLMAGSTTRA